MVLFCSELIGFKHLRCFEVPFRALHSAHDQCAKCLRVRLDDQLLHFGKPLSLANENEGFAVPSRTVADLYSPVLAFKGAFIMVIIHPKDGIRPASPPRASRDSQQFDSAFSCSNIQQQIEGHNSRLARSGHDSWKMLATSGRTGDLSEMATNPVTLTSNHFQTYFWSSTSTFQCDRSSPFKLNLYGKSNMNPNTGQNAH